jgi:hypothetical protein
VYLPLITVYVFASLVAIVGNLWVFTYNLWLLVIPVIMCHIGDLFRNYFKWNFNKNIRMFINSNQKCFRHISYSNGDFSLVVVYIVSFKWVMLKMRLSKEVICV